MLKLIIERKLNAPRGGRGNRASEACLWQGSRAVCGVYQRDVSVIKKIEGFGDNVRVPEAERHDLKYSEIKVDVLRSGKGVACQSEWPRGKGIGMLPVAVESGGWIRPEAATDTQDGCKLQAGQQTHHRAGAGVCRGVLRIVQVWPYQPKPA